jgi:hypothetical protein
MAGLLSSLCCFALITPIILYNDNAYDNMCLFYNLTLTLPNIETLIVLFESLRGRGRRVQVSPQWSDVHVYCFINFRSREQKVIEFGVIYVIENEFKYFFHYWIFWEKTWREFLKKSRIPSSLEDDHTWTNYTRTHLLVLRVKLPPGGSWKHFHSRVPVPKGSIAQIKWQINNRLCWNCWMLEYSWKLSSIFLKN